MENTISFNPKMTSEEIRKLDREVGEFNLQTIHTREVKRQMDKDDFLKLLIVQMKNQDPTNPIKNNESIAQMAQFSALEQMVKVGKSMENMAEANRRIEALTLLGKTVNYRSKTDDGIHLGRVSQVRIDKNGEALLMMGEEAVSFDQVTGINSSPPKADLHQPSKPIGPPAK